jgi:ABC-type oligopeptide transport system ATPase subunit
MIVQRVNAQSILGSGKSTLATSLLRFVEPTSGRIIVDGIDISTIGLNDIRTRLVSNLRSGIFATDASCCAVDLHPSRRDLVQRDDQR